MNLFLLFFLFFNYLIASEFEEVKTADAEKAPNFSNFSQSSREQYFEKIMGFDEDIIINLYKEKDYGAYNKYINEVLSVEEVELKNILLPTPLKKVITDFLPNFFLNNQINKKKFQTGFFEEISLKTLREVSYAKTTENAGTFNVIAGENTKNSSWFRHKLDIGAVQALSANKDAVFQVASNFSALEPTGTSHVPESGVTEYIYDHTQGPFASISAAPGVIYRMYYIFYSSQTPAEQWRQTTDKQIKLLDIFEKDSLNLFPTKNGYVVWSSMEGDVSPSDINKIKIGYHGNIQVTFGFVLGNNQVEINDSSQIINQVFTAAIDFGGTNSFLRDNPQAIKRGKLILDAAYEGTIKAAALHGKRKVFLTLIGGGVFGNDWDWIAESIVKNEDFIKKSGLDVTLFVYNLNTAIGDVNSFKKQMVQMANKCNGKFLIYKENGIYELQLDSHMSEKLYELQIQLNVLSSSIK